MTGGVVSVGVRIAAVCLCLCSLATAQGEFRPDFSPSLHIQKTSAEFDIDGRLTDPGWVGAARATGFVETDPGDQTQPTVRTEALVTYDESNLYVALIAWDDSAAVRVSMCDRDAIFRDDYIGLMLDTYGDMNWGYEIFVNPLGVQGDLRVLSDGNEDMAFDIVFSSRGTVTDSGYQVELAIPFASLRFPNTVEQTWRLGFWRDRQRDNRYRYSWSAQDRDNPCWMCQWGTLTGIRDIKPGSNLDILPNIIAYQSGERGNTYDPRSDYVNDDPDAELSLNVRYGVTTSSSIEFTANPDFSQVESDAGQIDVNQTFALYYSEHRPFFQEGSDLFDTWINVVHTRTINDPSLATKFTGQFGKLSVAYLLARDDNSPLILPFQQLSVSAGLENSTTNILRARQALWSNSYLGFSFTDRRLDGVSDGSEPYGSGSGTSYGIDGRFRFGKYYQIETQVLGSYTREINAPDLVDTTQQYGTAFQRFDNGERTVALDGEEFSGDAVHASLERNADFWSFDFDYWHYSPTFRVDNGFVTKNDTRQLSFNTSLYFRPNREWLRTWNVSMQVARVFGYNSTINLNPADFDDGTIDEWWRPALSIDLKKQTNLSLSYVASRERFNGFIFNSISRFSFDFSTRPSRALSCGVSGTTGRTIYRQRHRIYDEIIPVEDRVAPADSIRSVEIRPVMGVTGELSGWVSLKLGQRLQLVPELNYFQLHHRDAYLAAHPDEAKEIYSGYIFRMNGTYQFSRELFLRLIVEYDDFDKRLALEPLLTYKVSPFTVFYVGVNSRSRHHEQGDYGLENSVWRHSGLQVFSKLQYLFRI
ncbi:MAG: carbohydrate binding family 9 domain-containing protein [candidate division Zixibacteria bacterium]|nr:carbohydrate binding family 9 domain-containing protein [candidate division Zixibacteria bacterium]